MELTYRGKSYEVSTPDVEATLTGEKATFLGKSYNRKQYNVSTRQPSVELTYRGIRYSR
ncbi:MAG: DUF4278 domain-containing protein [Cyanobacteria bacterium J06638_6]